MLHRGLVVRQWMAGLMLESRIRRHERVSTRLAALDDCALSDLLDTAGPAGSTVGAGGESSTIQIEGITVFAKRIPLTRRELASPRSTANLFDLPVSCQYGMHPLASPGFGAWRELAANIEVTEGVLNDESAPFALLHHWRVLPGGPPLSAEYEDINAVAAQFGGDPAVRSRIKEMAEATSSLVLFLEHFPDSLLDRLTDPLGMAEALERQLRDATQFLRERQILHMDGHFGNMCADDRRLYVVDFGLATSPRFELTEAEREFVARHQDHDVDYAAMRLVNWLVTTVCGVTVPAGCGPIARDAFVRRCADGNIPHDVPALASGILARHAPAAARMNAFHRKLADGDSSARYAGAAR